MRRRAHKSGVECPLFVACLRKSTLNTLNRFLHFQEVWKLLKTSEHFCRPWRLFCPHQMIKYNILLLNRGQLSFPRISQLCEIKASSRAPMRGTFSPRRGSSSSDVAIKVLLLNLRSVCRSMHSKLLIDMKNGFEIPTGCACSGSYRARSTYRLMQPSGVN